MYAVRLLSSGAHAHNVEQAQRQAQVRAKWYREVLCTPPFYSLLRVLLPVSSTQLHAVVIAGIEQLLCFYKKWQSERQKQARDFEKKRNNKK